MRWRGFTLVELLVTIAVAAVLLGLAAPSFQGLLASHRRAAAVNQIVGAVALARSQAILERRTVTLCPGAGDGCLGRHQWHVGALVYVDHDGDGRLDREDRLLRAFPALEAGARVYWRAFQSRSYLQFQPRGYTHWQNGSFLYCPANDDPAHAQLIVVNAAGRVRLGRDTDGDGIVEKPGGGNVRCPP